MEENVFPSGAVAPILEKNFVEARLHTDGTTNVDEIKRLQEELTKSVANPYYVLQEPDGSPDLGKLSGLTTEEKFKELLNGALRQRTNAID
jgi:hypothetical protein